MPELETRAEPDDADRSASDPERGLTAAEVAERVERGQINDVPAAPTRTVSQIVRGNIFTRFNAILGAMLVVIIIVGPFQDALFGFVLVANAAIGIYQELRAQADPGRAHRPHRAEGASRPRRRGPGGGRRRARPGRRPRRHGRVRGRGGRRRARERRHGGRRIAPDRRIRTRSQGPGRRRVVGVVHRRRFGALPREQGGQGGLRGAAGAGRAPVHAHPLGTALGHRPHPHLRHVRDRPHRGAAVHLPAPGLRRLARSGLGRRRRAPSRWCPKGWCC